MADEIKALIGILGSLFALGIGFMIVTYAFSSLSQQQCQSYIDKINQDNLTIKGLYDQNNATTDLLNECYKNYTDLVNQNITKQDFVKIEGYYNSTQIQTTQLNQKFDTIITNYNNIVNTITNKYTISFIFNIGLALEIISFVFFNGELTVVIRKWWKRRKERKNHHPLESETSTSKLLN